MREILEIPDAICQICSSKVFVWELVSISHLPDDLELWCWCEACDVETFHPLVWGEK
jgi:hypothetical protein